MGQFPVTGQQTMSNSNSVAIASDQSTLPISQRAQNYPAATTMQNAATATGNGTTLDVAGYNAAIISIVGASTPSASVVIEASLDDTVWFGIPHMTVSSGFVATTAISVSTTETRELVNTVGFKSIRARISTYTSGTITCKGYLAPTGTSLATMMMNSSNAITIYDGGSSITVDGAVNATITDPLGTDTRASTDGVRIVGRDFTNTTYNYLEQLALTNSTPLLTAIVDGTGAQITSFGGTQYADADTGGTKTGNLQIWYDTSAGSYKAVQDSQPLPVEIKASTGLTVTFSALLQEDQASVSADTGIGALAIRKATPANTSSTDGDYEFLQVSNGLLWTQLGAALPAGTNAIGKLAANSGVTIGAVEIAASQTLATLTTLTGGGIAHDGVDSGNPVKVGARAVSSLAGATLVAAADRTDNVSDLDGVLVVRNQIPLGDLKTDAISNTDGASTASSVFTAVASTKNYITGIHVFRTDAGTTPIYVDFRDGTGGSVLWRMVLPPNGGSILPNGGAAWFKTSANTALAYDVSAATTTVYINVSGFQSKL